MAPPEGKRRAGPCRPRGRAPYALGVRVLAVDDDPRLRETVRRGLEAAGHACTTAADGEGARQALQQGPFDVILLDVMMPEEDGWQWLDALRATGNSTPVIFVTARDAVSERVRGLEAGADDYLIKPFAFDELLARMAAVVRRHGASQSLVRGPLVLHPTTRLVELDGQRLELSPREFELLLALARARGHVVARPQLLREVWGIDFDPGTNTVDVHVARLRRRLGPRGAALLRTVVGEGYRLVADGEG
jgi:DNA-binding response OmpR family regulator